MYEAFVSARLAAEAALDVLAGRAETVEPYADRLTDALGSLAGASWGAKIALDRFPASPSGSRGRRSSGRSSSGSSAATSARPARRVGSRARR